MRRFFLASVILALVLLTAPLIAQDGPESTKSTELPSVSLPPELDRVLRDYERAWRAGDAAALAALFAEDGFVLQSNRPPIRGRSAIKAAYEGEGGAALQLRALAYSADETVGYIIGAYGYGAASSDTGKFTLTLQRAPGAPWKIVSDMDNLNASPKKERASED